MSDLKKIQDAHGQYRKERMVADIDLQTAKAVLEQLNAREQEELKGLPSEIRKQRANEFAEEKKSLGIELENLTGAKKNLTAQYEMLTAGFLTDLDPVEKVTALEDHVPILLFPLRLETRFKNAGNVTQLWLRVYPDDCNINTKEDLLSESELKNAKAFWVEIWKAGGIEAEERGAWRSLVNSHGTGRSAWIIEEYKPIGSKPVKSDNRYKILVIETALMLTDDEKKAADNYWVTTWMAKGDSKIIAEAEAAFVTATSSAKAVEIKEKYVPVNLTDVLPQDQDVSKIFVVPIEFPAYTPKKSSWTQAARSMALPDKFVVTVYQGGNKKNIPFPNPVKDHLAVSVDPSLNVNDQVKKDTDQNIILNEELSWMVDFDKAVAAGMAMRINLTPAEAVNGFDKLFVTGIRFTSDYIDGKEQLEKLLTDHYYSKNGFGLLKQGTPTNNTEDSPAGHSWSDNADESYDILFKKKEDFIPADAPDKKSDGEKLADGLGIDASLFKKVANANGKDQLEAFAMNTALFPATLGYFMDEMMDPIFTERDIENTRVFFASFVSGRGPLPAIRIGKQPYGILPISVYSRLNFMPPKDIGLAVDHKTGEQPFLARLHSLLMKMDSTWDSLLPGVAHIGKAGDPHQVLLDVIGLHANSIEFHQRYAQSIQQLYNQLNLQMGPLFATLITGFITQRGKTILQQLGLPEQRLNLPILEKYFLSKPNLLSGAFIDDVPDSETNPIRPYSADGKNYIEWLITTDSDKIRTENFGGNSAPTALLYLLLKHGLTQSEAGTATNLLLKHDIINSRKVFHDPDFIHVEKNDTGKSKFEHLYNNYPTITGDANLKLVDHIRNPNVLQNLAEARHLKATIDALKILEKTPTARLERLLAEHLDCCNYRIDAWKTGLVQYKLTEQRFKNHNANSKEPNKGIFLGAYGWLLDVKPENKVLSNVQLSPELDTIFNKGNNTTLQSDSTNLGYIHAPSLNQAAAAAILRNAFDSNKNAGTANPFAINLTSDRVRNAANFLEGMRNGQSLSALLGYQFERGLHDKHGLGLGEADMFIYPLRRAFPLVGDKLKDTQSKPEESQETIEANNVIDGLGLINYVKKSATKIYPFGLAGNLNMPVADASQAKAIKDELNRIIDIQDAISDLVISEQVYQVVQGNFERAAGNAEAFSKGSYPPDIDIISSPRSGITITHRMAIQFDADAMPPAGAKARAKAEPSVNKWLIDKLPAPENVLCSVSYSNPVMPETPITISQKDLGLEPIDLLYVFNTDNEQALTELDDRILHFVRYKKSDHPKTDIKINYTTSIDINDRTKISFFELGALIRSMQKILMGTKFISPAKVLQPIETVAQASILNDVQLKGRVVSLMNDLGVIKTAISGIVVATKSIAGFTEDLKTALNSLITNTSTKEAIFAQLKNDMLEYFVNPVVTNKDDKLNAFENSISVIGVPATVTALRTSYEQYLLQYHTDFANLDKLIENTTGRFLEAAMFNNVQTGTGFIHDAISRIYNSVFAKTDKLIERWDKKIVEFNTIMAGFSGAPNDTSKIEILRKAERVVSYTSTINIPAVSIYKTNVENIKTNFDNVLAELKALKANTQKTITGFINDTETVLNKISTHDVVSFDMDNDRNDLRTEKLQLALLKEDIVTALSNLQKFQEGKIADCATAIGEADATVVNADKIVALLNAAKKILGDDALLLPQFMINGSAAIEFANAIGDSDVIQNYSRTKEGRLFPVDDWIAGLARVRDKVHHWENITILTNAFNPTSSMDLVPIQFPYQPNDRWLAMKFRDESDPAEKDANGKFIFNINNDKLLYTAHYAKNFDQNKPQCGIILDEWTELIPAGEETTGIAFHYDQPNSEPPQTMLLVTPPNITGSWKWNDIIDAMEETLDMAKKRAVEPAQIETSSYAQFLPTTMTAVSMYWITAALNLAANNNIYKIMKDGN